MPSSPARIAANRRNAARSTGPRTPGGKLISRCNATKHGLTGEGVALPSEDHAGIERRFRSLDDEFQPTTESSRIHIRRYAFLSVRLERCERFETKVLCQKVRNAIADYDDQRMTQVEAAAALLNHEPMTASRRLQGTPEGIDWLVEYWLELREDLMVEDRKAWTPQHWARTEALLGNMPGNFRIGRTCALTEAVNGFFANLDPEDGAGLDDASRSRWARDELAKVIDAEVARLREEREALDPEAIEKDRIESVDRALFDASPEMTLARKYEAATERGMYRALDQFYAAERAAAEPRPEPATIVVQTTCESVGSFEQAPEVATEPPAEPVKLPRRSIPDGPKAAPGSPRTVPMAAVKALMDEIKALEDARNGPE